MDIIIRILSIVVIVLLVGTLIYLTRMIKAKGNKAEKDRYAKITGAFFLAYLTANLLRLYLEQL